MPNSLKQLSQLPSTQQQHYKSLRHTGRRQQYLCSRLLICKALSEQFNQPLHSWQIEERSDSVPVIHNLPKPGYISLSHSKELIGFALSADRLGIDLEYKKSSRDFNAAAELFMSAREIEAMPNQKTDLQDYFYRLWCAKEAIYKALPVDEQNKATLASLSYEALKAADSPWHLHETGLNNFQIAIVSLSPMNPESIHLKQIKI